METTMTLRDTLETIASLLIGATIFTAFWLITP